MGNWTTVYNASDSHWGIEGLEDGQSYTFRVRALNRIGWSPYSDNSTDIVFAAWMQGRHRSYTEVCNRNLN